MTDPNPINPEKKISFWETVTGVIVKITGLIAAITGLIFAVNQLMKSDNPKVPLPFKDTVEVITTEPVNPCPSRTDYVSSKNIQTTSSDAQLISGDTEIDSDDWTGVELSYNIERINGDREIQINVKWYSQEKNRDRRSVDTRIMSSKVISLYKMEGCPELVIKHITGLELQGSKTEDFQGEVHDFVSFPDCGSLRGVTVRFDGKGKNDVSRQSLTAHIPNFSVVIGPK